MNSGAELLENLNALTEHHIERNPTYRYYVESLFSRGPAQVLQDVPFLPVRAFKRSRLSSVPENQVFKRMFSSGTGGDGRSQIVVDRSTARLQTKGLISSLTENFGPIRLPMLVLDSPPRPGNFTARHAAISGFSTYSRGLKFAFDAEDEFHFKSVEEFAHQYPGSPTLIFGFTFQVWTAVSLIRDASRTFSLSHAVLLHGGGWKKLEAHKVSRDTFREGTFRTLGVKEIRDYYGMIEQTGTIYIECSHGSLHSPSTGEFLIRNPITLEIVPDGEQGLIQVFSTLQRSFPGHSLLTDDIGSRVPGRCACGSDQSRLAVIGRMNRSEIRGCSDAV